MNPISSARTGEKRVWIRREGGRRTLVLNTDGTTGAYPLGIRLRIGPFQLVIGWLNRFAIWWNYRSIVDFYQSKPGPRVES